MLIQWAFSACYLLAAVFESILSMNSGLLTSGNTLDHFSYLVLLAILATFSLNLLLCLGVKDGQFTILQLVEALG